MSHKCLQVPSVKQLLLCCGLSHGQISLCENASNAKLTGLRFFFFFFNLIQPYLFKTINMSAHDVKRTKLYVSFLCLSFLECNFALVACQLLSNREVDMPLSLTESLLLPFTKNVNLQLKGISAGLLS